MSVFGKIATRSLAGMAADIHIRVDHKQPERPPKSLKNRPFQATTARSTTREVTAL
jgi:hypothetical protein